MADAYSYALLVELGESDTPKLKNKLVKYFQSKKSGGGDCQVDYDNGSRTATVRFRREEDQKSVLARGSHQISLDKGALRMTVRLPTHEAAAQESPSDKLNEKSGDDDVKSKQPDGFMPAAEEKEGGDDEAVDEDLGSTSAVLGNVPESLGQDFLEMLVSCILKDPGSPSAPQNFTVELIPDISSAVVTFQSGKETTDFVARCPQNRMFTNKGLSVHPLEVTQQVVVEDLRDVNEDLLNLYFEDAGGEVESVVLTEAEQSAIVTFKDHKDVQKVVKKKHCIKQEEVRVYPFYQSLGTALYGKDKPSPKLPAAISEAVDSAVWRYLNDNHSAAETVHQHMAKHFCNVDLSKSTVLLSPESSLLQQKDAKATIKEWRDTVKSAFAQALSKFKSLKLQPESELWEESEKTIRQALVNENVVVVPDKGSGVLSVAGPVDDVTRVERHLQEVLNKIAKRVQREKSSTTKKIKVSQSIFNILCQDGLEDKLQSVYPDLKMSFGKDSPDLTVTGLKDEIITATQIIVDAMLDLRRQNLEIDKYVLDLLKDEQPEELTDALLTSCGINAAFEIKAQRVRLVAVSDKDLNDAEEHLVKLLITQCISVEDSEVLRKPEWAQLVSQLENDNNKSCRRIRIHVTGQEVVVSGHKDDVMSVSCELEDFLKQNALVEEKDVLEMPTDVATQEAQDDNLNENSADAVVKTKQSSPDEPTLTANVMTEPEDEDDEATDEELSSTSAVIRNIPENLGQDFLELLVESISPSAAETFTLELNRDISSAVVTFQSGKETAEFVTRCPQKRAFTAKGLSVQPLELTQQVVVEDLNNLNEDLISLYFENEGGEVENVEFNEAEGSAIITFKDHKAVQKVVKTKHRIKQEEVRVYPFYQSLGTALYGKDKPSPKLPAAISEAVDSAVWRYLNDNQSAADTVHQHMAKHFCNVDLSKSTVLLSPESSLLQQKDAKATIKEWRDTVKSAFAQALSKFKSLKLQPESELWEESEKTLRMNENVVVVPDKGSGVLSVAGPVDDVTRVQQQLQEVLNKMKLSLRHGSSVNSGKGRDALGNALQNQLRCEASIDEEDFEEDLSVTQQNKSAVIPEKRFEFRLPAGVQVSVWKGDLTNWTADAVVNAANDRLQHYGGLAKALSRAGGPQIQRESDDYISRYGSLKTGDAIITGAGSLPCRKIIHAIGPLLASKSDLSWAQDLLKKAIWRILKLAEEANLKTVAIPAISSGISNYPLPQCAEDIVKTVKHYYERSSGPRLMEIQLVNHDEPTVKEMERACRQILFPHQPPTFSQAAAGSSRGAAKAPTPTSLRENVHLILKKAQIKEQQLSLRNVLSVNMGKGGASIDEEDFEQQNKSAFDQSQLFSRAAAGTSRGAAKAFTPTALIGNVHLRLEKGKIEEQQTDVIVNTIGSKIDRSLSSGVVSKAILQRAGDELQKEMYHAHSTEYAIITSGQNLQCREVYHTFCSSVGISTAQHAAAQENLFKSVLHCLELAAAKGHKTIAFPAIGTGGLGFRKKEVAQIMSDAVASFGQKSTKKMEVHFVIFPADNDTFKAFEEHMRLLQQKATQLSRTSDVSDLLRRLRDRRVQESVPRSLQEKN